ncbi:beta strand repeat-containing protein, partial [Sessilibacter corallicola]|uniref:beta strand repeat-containing protein n=1 Tax=Sessilibacter corallicola TaxID=2904075 RepID=UPI001E65779F
FADVNSVAGGGANDSVDLNNDDAAINAASDFTSNGIQYTDVNRATNTNALTGTAGDDSFVQTDANEVTVASIEFADVNSVAGGGANDSVDLNNDDAAINAASDFTSNGIQYTNVNRATNTNTLTGTAGDDSFVQTDTNEVTVASIEFADVSSVEGNGGNDSVDLNNDDAAINAASDFTSNGIQYANVNNATNTDVLTGTAGDDSFVQTDANEVTVASIEFADVSSVEGNGGNDSVDLNNDDATINGASDFTSNGIQYINVNNATNTDVLTGTAGDDSFVQTDANEVTVASIEFADVSSVEGNGGNDSVDLNNDDAAINAASDFTSNGIQYTNVNNATNTDTLTGTAGDDSFVQTDANEVTVASIEFADVSSVEGNGGNDSVDLNNDDAAINGASDFTSNGIQYTNVNNATNTDTLTGTAGDDSFVQTDANEVTVASIEFADVSSVEGNGGNDSVDLNNDDATINGASDFTSNGIQYTNVNNAINTDALTGTAGDDSFVQTDANEVTVASIEFADVNSVAGGGANDSVDLNNDDAAINATSDFTSNGIQYTNVNSATNTDILTGTAGDDSFVQTDANEVTVASIEFADVNSVAGGGANDSVDLNNDDAAINATSDFTSNGIRYTNVNRATNTNALTGTAGDDSFVQTDANEVTVASIEFADVNSVAGGGANDSVDLNNDDAAINGASDFTSNGIRYTNVNSATNTNALTGTAGDDSFVQTDANEVTVASIEFADVNSVAGGGANDSVDLNNDDAAINAASDFTSNGIRYTNVNSATNTDTLTGTAGDDSFAQTDTNEVTVASIE